MAKSVCYTCKILVHLLVMQFLVDFLPKQPKYSSLSIKTDSNSTLLIYLDHINTFSPCYKSVEIENKNT